MHEIEVALDQLGERTPTTLEKAGLGAFLMNFYKGFESILKQIAYFEDIELPSGSNWHIELFNRFLLPMPSGRSALFDESAKNIIGPYRQFRHVFIHGDGINLDWGLMEGIVRSTPQTFIYIRTIIQNYLLQIQQFCDRTEDSEKPDRLDPP